MSRVDSVGDPARIIREPGPEYACHGRQFQGIPGIERARNGRLWATWYGGGSGEGPGNYVMLATSGDDGRTWTPPVQVAAAPTAEHRTFDPGLWGDPQGRLWWFWSQSKSWFDGEAGVWMAVCEDAGRADAAFGEPRYVAPGIMMNKPTVLSDGTWLLPIARWSRKCTAEQIAADKRYSWVYHSVDGGRTFEPRGWADVPGRTFDEHMTVQRRDGSVWMLVRTISGIGESTSYNGGWTWTAGKDSGIGGPDSRFFIRRLRSGRLLLVNHDHSGEGRRQRHLLTAWVSEDDGYTWPHKLLLDERLGVSYPDATEDEQGMIHVIYDFNRGHKGAFGREREILLATFTEGDITAGRLVGPDSRLRTLVNKATD